MDAPEHSQTFEALQRLHTLQVDSRPGVAIVRLNRPPVNAVDRTMMRELTECFGLLSESREIGAVVLGATGERAFCGGIELRSGDQAEPSGVREQLDPYWRWRQTQSAVRECLVPVLAALEGPAIGAGFGLVGVCDLVIAGESASFALKEIEVGLLGGASKALRLLGPSKARRMLLLGESIPAAELHRLGGIEEVVPKGQAEARAIELADAMAAKSPLALRLAKQSILRIEGDELMENYRTENQFTQLLGHFNDAREALAAYREKRAPKWTWS